MTVVVACLGDSITEGSPYWDSRRQVGDPEGQWEHWAALRHQELVFRNHGIWRERSDQIAARFSAAVEGAEVLLVQGGINDLAQGRPVEQAARNLEQLVRGGLSLGLRVGICDVLPWNNGWPDAEPKVRLLNELVAQIAREEDVPLLEFHDTLEDPDNPGRMKAEWTFEGNHPSVEGYRLLGERAFRLP